jgi:glycosyltransferase involved in cell wall biosynthesis
VKLLLVNTLYHPGEVGGAERSVRLLAEELVRSGQEVAVICAAPARAPARSDLNGVAVHRVRLKNLYWPFREAPNPRVLKPLWHALDAYNPWMARAVGRILDEERPDVVHTHNLAGFSASVWRQAEERRLPLVHTLRDYYLLCPRSSLFRGEGRDDENCRSQCLPCKVVTLARRRLSRKVDHVVGISRFVLERHLRCGYFAGVEGRGVIYNGVERVLERAAGPVRGHALRLGFLGRLHPEKGIGRLVRSFGATGLSREASLVVAGTGPADYVESLKREAARSAVEFVGSVAPRELFSRIDVLVVPSLCLETLSRAILESYAHGVPVIGSSRGGIPEIIEDGRTGFIFDPDEQGGLAQAVRRILDAPGLLDRMREAALAKAEELSPERMAAEHLRVYESVLRHGKARGGAGRG